MENASAGAAAESNRSERASPGAAAVAFEDVYAEHRRAVYRYLRGWGRSKVSEVRSAATSSDAARNLAIDMARRRESSRRGLRLWPRAEAAPDPAELVLRDESDRLLAQRVAALPAAQREAIVLRFTGGLAAREIGLVLGRSEAAAHKLISRALAALREAYDDEE